MIVVVVIFSIDNLQRCCLFSLSSRLASHEGQTSLPSFSPTFISLVVLRSLVLIHSLFLQILHIFLISHDPNAVSLKEVSLTLNWAHSLRLFKWPME